MKKEAETGNTIPYAGAGFQIYDPSGNLVSMTFTYPEVTTIDTFYTTADGELITPQTLEYGTGYSLVEVQAPYGYVLNSDSGRITAMSRVLAILFSLTGTMRLVRTV